MSSSPPLSKKVAVVLQKSGTGDSKAQDELDKESAAYLRRREQVRRAQRTHRERKENYIKALEDELFQVKARERKIAEENKALNAEVAQLRDLVTLDESQWCSTQWTGFNSVIPNATSECSMAISDGSDYMSLAASSEWQIPSQMGGECAMSSASLESVVPTVSASPHSLDLAMVPAWRPATFNTNQVNRTELAVEFVMTLEKPCLNRATSAILDIGQPYTDQALNVSGATSYHTYLEDSFLASNAVEEINPELSLEKLHSLSSAFELTDELTPIQAWQQIVSHPGFGSLGLKKLTKLVEDMLEYIRCYGFGAVIEKTTFDTLCRNLFAGKCYPHVT